MTLLSPRLRADLTALARPSASASWQLTRVTSFLCIGLRREYRVSENSIMGLIRRVHRSQKLNRKSTSGKLSVNYSPF